MKLIDIEIDEVSLVDKPANGKKFLILKRDDEAAKKAEAEKKAADEKAKKEADEAKAAEEAKKIEAERLKAEQEAKAKAEAEEKAEIEMIRAMTAQFREINQTLKV